MEILYKCEDFIICVKPVGMDSETELPHALGIPAFPIHRLDKNVGGVMVYALNRSAAATLSREVQNGGLVKEYLAVVHGFPEREGVWEDLLFKDAAKNKVYVVDRVRRGVKTAKLSYSVVKRLGDTTLVRVRLYTGRSHQIRVQFASRRFPLVGDRKYGGRDGASAPMLFSCALTFSFGGREYHFEASPDWEELSL